MHTIDFKFKKDFNKVAARFNWVIVGNDIILKDKRIKDMTIRAIYDVYDDKINLNLNAFKDYDDIITEISTSIQHECVHKAINMVIDNRTWQSKSEEWIVSKMLDNDYMEEYNTLY